MIHIVFETANIEALSKAFELDETIRGEIIEIKDDYAVGPIVDIYDTYGYQQRRDWWKAILEFTPYKEQTDMVNDKLTVHQLIRRLEGVVADQELNAVSPVEEEGVEKQANHEVDEVWIWMGQNQHDVSGYYWLMSQLKNYQGKIQVLYLNNLPFINEKGLIFYPQNLFEIQPKEFLKAKKLARPITLSEFEVDPDEWKKMCNENAVVRILEGGKKLLSKEESYYDKELLTFISTDFQKVNKVLNSAVNKMKNKASDVFLFWRMHKLVEEGKLAFQGELSKGWKEVEVRLSVQEAL